MRGTEKELLEGGYKLILGEIGYLTDKRQIVVGNPESEKGFDVVSKVVLGPHDSDFYARLEGHDKYIPVGMNIRERLSLLSSKIFPSFKNMKEKFLVPFSMPSWREHL